MALMDAMLVRSVVTMLIHKILKVPDLKFQAGMFLIRERYLSCQIMAGRISITRRARLSIVAPSTRAMVALDEFVHTLDQIVRTLDELTRALIQTARTFNRRIVALTAADNERTQANKSCATA